MLVRPALSHWHPDDKEQFEAFQYCDVDHHQQVTMSDNFRRARLATMAVLFCNGMLYSTWGVYIPAIKQKFTVSDGLLAMAMVAVAAGGIVTLARAGLDSKKRQRARVR